MDLHEDGILNVDLGSGTTRMPFDDTEEVPAPYELFFVFDVESAGLYGEGFAVGYAVVDREGTLLDDGYFGAPFETVECPKHDHDWVATNVLPHLPEPNCKDPEEVRSRFWSEWVRWRGEATPAADVPYPVETAFVRACVLQRPQYQLIAPYPLIDVASVLLAAGDDPIGTYARLPSELPAHHPTADAKQSARLMIEALNITQRKSNE